MIRAYPKIFSIGTDYIIDIFKEDVEITEKIDGSQFVFGKIDGTLHMRSKGAVIYPEVPDGLFKEVVEYVKSIETRLPDNLVFYCEYLKKPKHNCLVYDRVPKNYLMLFGVMKFPAEKFLPLDEWVDVLGVETVPKLYVGRIEKVEEILRFLETDSILGNTKVEGIVVKNYYRPFLLGGQPIPLMAGKFVSEKFKEVHRKEWKVDPTKKSGWQTFCESFRTEARWQKAVQHLREKGLLLNAPQDIGNLIAEVKNDIQEEEREAVLNFIWKEFANQLLKTATRGLPEWYKEELLKRNLEKEEK